MAKYYTDEKNAQIVIALLKAHGINKIIASPGTTNIPIVGSVQSDPFFRIYSAPDERSAAYIACGLACEFDEPVVLSCTGATASRNYLSGLTEAYYRKLPVLAITSSTGFANIGHLAPQLIDRNASQNDIARLSVTLPVVKDKEDFWECESKVNSALLELKRCGGGPAHINLCTTYTGTFNTQTLPEVRIVDRILPDATMPLLPHGKIAVFIGAHKVWTKDQTEILDRFCFFHDAVVLCDHTSNYRGKFRLLSALACSQQGLTDYLVASGAMIDTLIHIGEVSGDYPTQSFLTKVRQVWRVSEDGEIRDRFRKLRYIFEMPESKFFEMYSDDKENIKADGSFHKWKTYLSDLYSNIPELPFSNAWIASEIAHQIPDNSVLHLGILNSLRAWNYFDVPASVQTFSNVGGFGIDGPLSTLIGASLAHPQKLFFGVVGDLAFFYDMNSLGNRHVKNNLRILLVNNGRGTEFRIHSHIGNQFGDQADEYIAAAHHYGNQSPVLVKHYAQDLGFEYMSAATKQEFLNAQKRFLSPEITQIPMLFEVFTNHLDESSAIERLENIDWNIKGSLKKFAQKVLPNIAVEAIKTFRK